MATIYDCRPKSTLALRHRRRWLVQQLGLPPGLLRASLVERFGTCGRTNCRCQRGQRHGPFYYLTQCLDKRGGLCRMPMRPAREGAGTFHVGASGHGASGY